MGVSSPSITTLQKIGFVMSESEPKEKVVNCRICEKQMQGRLLFAFGRIGWETIGEYWTCVCGAKETVSYCGQAKQ